MKYTIDRFEEGYVICELDNGTMIEIERLLIPPIAKEGDVIIYENGIYTVDNHSTEERKKHIRNKMRDLWS